MARPKAFGYLRVSTAEQVEQGFGLDVQDAAIRAYCKAHGLRLVETFSDEGISGSNGLDTRRGLAQALARIEAGEASSLIVYRLDRLARDLILQETTIQSLRATGATVLSVSEPDTDSDDPSRVLMRQMMGAFSQYERTLIRGRMMAGRAAKMAAGGYGGGHTRYGLRVEQGVLVEDPDEAKVVAKVTRMRTAGDSYRSICGALTEAEMFARSGNEFSPNQVRRIAIDAGVA
jgi:DNA invertase Pin-like site-specific DNA recombinase